MTGVAVAAAVLWLIVLGLPWRPWSTCERLEPAAPPVADTQPARDVSVLIPARDEAATTRRTLDSLLAQAEIARIIVVDDQSRDATARIVREVAGESGDTAVELVPGRATPPGWSGKLWALEQGLERVDTPLVLLLDADIRLHPHMVSALVEKLEHERLDQVSIMARLPAGHWPEKLLLPAFVFFFKQLYPFAWVNRPDRPFAAAAGGCVLARTERLRAAGAFGSWKNALIDDCELARRMRDAGGQIWLGLSHGVESLRRHPDVGSVIETVARTAYTQLRHSPALLLVVTVVMLLAFAVPPAALVTGAASGRETLALAGGIGWLLMAGAYLPQTRFSRLAPGWALCLPIAAGVFLFATWKSAGLHWSGTGAGWKGRSYRDVDSGRLR